MELWKDRLDMSTLDRVLPSLSGVKQDENKDKISKLITSYSDIFADVMDRYVVYRERTQFLDIRENYPRIKLRAWPIGLDAITGEPLVSLYNDNGFVPSYSSQLTYQYDYRVYTSEEGQGKVEFNTGLFPGFQALKATWTGGMATKPEVAMTDADTANPGGGANGTLESLASSFEDDLVEVGMTITMTATGNQYTIASIVDNQHLTIDEEWDVTDIGAGLACRIEEAGFVGRYPKIEQALITQIVFHWKRKDKLDVKRYTTRGGAGGMDTEFIELNPMDLIPEVKRTLIPHQLREYP